MGGKSRLHCLGGYMPPYIPLSAERTSLAGLASACENPDNDYR